MKRTLLLLTMKPSILVGGQAVIEGVMMRVPGAYATAVRDPDGKIHIQKKEFQSITERSKFWKQPIFRGMASLFEAMKMGMATLQYSVDIAMPEEEEQSKISEFLSTVLPLVLP
jgi:Predicted metal-dependent enzyme